MNDSVEQSAPVATPATPQSPSPPAALEYDRSGNHVTRGQFRIFLILLSINTIAVCGYLLAPSGLTFARQAWRDYEAKRATRAAEQKRADAVKKRVADFQKALPSLAGLKVPADAPVYTEDPLEAASLIASDPAYETVPMERGGIPASAWQPAAGRAQPVEASTLAGFVGRDSAGPSHSDRPVTVLLQARKTPSGDERLVWCELDAKQRAHGSDMNEFIVTTSRTLRVRLIEPGSPTRPPSVRFAIDTTFDQGADERSQVRVGHEPRTPQIFRLEAGVPDPSDPTRVTLPYSINGVAGAFRVRVLEGDRLSVEQSDGRIVERSGGTRVTQTWLPSTRPAVRLTQNDLTGNSR